MGNSGLKQLRMVGEGGWADGKDTMGSRCRGQGQATLPYRQGPADAGERAVEAEQVDQVKGEDHYQVANGDHFEVSVGAVAGPRRAPHTDEGNQQSDLGHQYRYVRETPTKTCAQGTNSNQTTENGGTATPRVTSPQIGWESTISCKTSFENTSPL